eukprot:7378306-Prymnesium_polylepis.2
MAPHGESCLRLHSEGHVQVPRPCSQVVARLHVDRKRLLVRRDPFAHAGGGDDERNEHLCVPRTNGFGVRLAASRERQPRSAEPHSRGVCHTPVGRSGHIGPLHNQGHVDSAQRCRWFGEGDSHPARPHRKVGEHHGSYAAALLEIGCECFVSCARIDEFRTWTFARDVHDRRARHATSRACAVRFRAAHAPPPILQVGVGLTATDGGKVAQGCGRCKGRASGERSEGERAENNLRRPGLTEETARTLALPKVCEGRDQQRPIALWYVDAKDCAMWKLGRAVLHDASLEDELADYQVERPALEVAARVYNAAILNSHDPTL